MHPFINQDKKIVFWWSTKCGCSTVKSMMLNMMGISNKWPHTPSARGKVKDLKPDIKYTHVLFVRNIFDRFVSGFLDKSINYSIEKREYWSVSGNKIIYAPTCFLEATNNIHLLDAEHFNPQTGDEYDDRIKYDYKYDINSINYEELSDVCKFKFDSIRLNQNKAINKNNQDFNICYESIETLIELKKNRNVPPYSLFYNENTIKNIKDFYKSDFIFLKSLGFDNCCNLN